MPRRWPSLHRRGELRQDRQNERRRLSRAGLRDADEIVPREDVRDGRGLDGSRLGVTGFLDRLQNLGGKIECSKGHKTGTIVRLGLWRTCSYPAFKPEGIARLAGSNLKQ